MAYRAIQDTVSASETLAGLTHWEERLYWRLLSQTDACGRLPGTARKIRALCTPLVPVQDEEVAQGLEGLVGAGRIALGCVNGVWVCELVDFTENQPAGLIGKAHKSRFPSLSAQHIRVGSAQEKRPEEKKEEKPIAATPSPAKRAGRGKRRDPEFEAVLEVCGIDASSITQSGRGAINRALKDIRSVGATADEIRARAVEYRRRFTVPLTAPALAKHWGSLAAASAPEWRDPDEAKADKFRRRSAQVAAAGGLEA